MNEKIISEKSDTIRSSPNRSYAYQPAKAELSLENISLHTNVYSVMRLRCEKENSKGLNKFLSMDKDFYLVKGCNQIICDDECYDDIQIHHLPNSSIMSLDIIKYCFFVMLPIDTTLITLGTKFYFCPMLKLRKSSFFPNKN